MKPTPDDLRLDVTPTDPPDDLVHRLAALARASTPTARRGGRRTAAVVAGLVGAVGLSVGGAWATGAVTIPGLPQPRQETPTAPVTPSRQPIPTPTSPAPTTGGPSSGVQNPGTPGPASGPGVPDGTTGSDPRPSQLPSQAAEPATTHASPSGTTGPTKKPHPTRKPHPTKKPRPSQAATPAQPTRPAKPTKPSEPARPTNPARPTKSATPTDADVDG